MQRTANRTEVTAATSADSVPRDTATRLYITREHSSGQGAVMSRGADVAAGGGHSTHTL
jgi:hypothetical protein